jgi:hypothetical protein
LLPELRQLALGALLRQGVCLRRRLGERQETDWNERLAGPT